LGFGIIYGHEDRVITYTIAATDGALFRYILFGTGGTPFLVTVFILGSLLVDIIIYQPVGSIAGGYQGKKKKKKKGKQYLRRSIGC